MTRPLLLAALVFCGCAHGREALDRSQSLGTPTTADIEDVPVSGFEIDIDGAFECSGELVAVDDRSVYVQSERRLWRIDRRGITGATLTRLYSAAGGVTAAWTAGGAVSTVSHGLFLIFTFPMWIIAGTISGIAGGAENNASLTPADLDRLRQFARFPQGLPASLANDAVDAQRPSDVQMP